MAETKSPVNECGNLPIAVLSKFDSRGRLLGELNQMDQRSIGLSLARTSISAVDLYAEPVATLDADTMNASSGKRFLREAKCTLSNLLISFSEEYPPFDDSGEAVVLGLAKQPFASIHSLSRFIDGFHNPLGSTRAILDVFPIVCRTLNSQIGLKDRGSCSPSWRFQVRCRLSTNPPVDQEYWLHRILR
jgi:hypothetical protein